MLVASTFAGCAGVFGFDATSGSLGWHANGALRHPAALPTAGDGYVIPSPWRERRSNFGSDELVGLLTRAARAVEQTSPEGTPSSETFPVVAGARRSSTDRTRTVAMWTSSSTW